MRTMSPQNTSPPDSSKNRDDPASAPAWGSAGLRVARRDGTVRPLSEPHDTRGRPALRKRREPADVIRVAMRDQDSRERRTLERRLHRIEVRRVASAASTTGTRPRRNTCCCRSDQSGWGCQRAAGGHPCLKF